MTFKDLKEIMSLSLDELEKELQQALKELQFLNFENSQGSLKDTASVKKTRRYIAQIRTAQSAQRQQATDAAKTKAAA